MSANEITLRVGSRWLRFTPGEVVGSEQAARPFHLNENGTVAVGDGDEEEMDIAAERFAREMMDATE